MGQAAQEPAFFKRRDQPVDARLGRKIQRLLHFIEGGRNAGLFDPLMDVEQQFFLFRCQHDLDQMVNDIGVLYPFTAAGQVQFS